MKESIATRQSAGAKFTAHSVNITDRKKVVMSGIVKVDCATAAEISLCACLGRLLITGSELQIVKFDESDGNLAIAGNIDGIKYASPRVPLFKRLFK